MYLETKNLNVRPGFAREVHKPFTLPHIVAWLEKQPPERPYYYDNMGQCLLGLYTFENGGTLEDAEYKLGGHPLSSDPWDLPNQIYCVVSMTPWTMGAALRRARSAFSLPRAAVLP